MPFNLVDRCRQSVWLICIHLRSHCHHNLKSHTVFIFSFVNAVRIKTFMYENQQSSVKYRVLCMFGGSSNCVWGRNLSFKCEWTSVMSVKLNLNFKLWVCVCGHVYCVWVSCLWLCTAVAWKLEIYCWYCLTALVS